MIHTGTVCSSQRRATCRSTPSERACALASASFVAASDPSCSPAPTLLTSTFHEDGMPPSSPPSPAVTDGFDVPVSESSSRFISSSRSSLFRSAPAASVSVPSPLARARSARAASNDSSDRSARSRSGTVRAPLAAPDVPAKASRMRWSAVLAVRLPIPSPGSASSGSAPVLAPAVPTAVGASLSISSARSGPPPDASAPASASDVSACWSDDVPGGVPEMRVSPPRGDIPPWPLMLAGCGRPTTFSSSQERKGIPSLVSHLFLFIFHMGN